MLQEWLPLPLPSAKENQSVSRSSAGSTCPSVRFTFLLTLTAGSAQYSDGSNLVLAGQKRETE